MVHKIIRVLIIGFVIFSLSGKTINAAENNKFGIHLAQPDSNDIQKAAELVNSQGGEWGYITLVIQENDRDRGKWQDVFNQLRKQKLIPIIRLATQPEGAVWKRPTKEDATEWANFLNSLHWVVKDRYVILFNEPNHASEWGGTVDASNYRDVALEFAKKLKEKSPDFDIMLAGLDASAPSSLPNYEDENFFLSTVFDTDEIKKEWNELLSGWTSHSYPNPGFVGSPTGSGKGSIRTYDWEENLLQSWGIKELPIFITETGWDGDKLGRDTVASYLRTAYESIWLPDDRVKAVTPFILNYQSAPFTNFSWKMAGSDLFYPQYEEVQSIHKKAGDPAIIDKGSISFDFSSELVKDSSYHLRVTLKNMGQAIWDRNDDYKLVLQGVSMESFFSNLSDIQPFQTQEVDLFLKTDTEGKQKATIALYKGDKKILESVPWSFEVLPRPELDFTVSLAPKASTTDDHFELQIFDEKEQFVFQKTGIAVNKNKGQLGEIQNVALGRKYRVVILHPYYLPRQGYVQFKRGVNEIKFERMLPLDFDKDGNFDLNDIGTVFNHPSFLRLLLP